MAKSRVKLGTIDLNLLVVFDAVMHERSVTRAGHRLGLSQPALSHALARLRHMLKDELFVRSPRGMVPTPRAEQLAAPVRRALDGLQRSLESPQFDPVTATRTFRIAADNYAAMVMVGPLAARIANAAPKVLLEILPSSALDILELLDRGELDLAIGGWARQGERFSHRPLLHDNYVAVLRKSHPAARSRELSIERFAALPHVEFASRYMQADFVDYMQTDFVDAALKRTKLSRRITLRVPMLSSPRVLTASDLIAILPLRMAQYLVRGRPLVIRRLPIPSPVVETAMTWPRWLDDQPAHRWLRDKVGQVTSEIRR